MVFVNTRMFVIRGAIILSIIISGQHFSEALKCYNCTDCSQPTKLVDCPTDQVKCIIATGYLTNGTFQMVRSCTSIKEDFYDWSIVKKQTFNGVDYVNVSVITCFQDQCNNDDVPIPIEKVECYSCVKCKTPTNGTDICDLGCLTAAGLSFNGSYEVLRSCATSDVANYDGDGTYLFQKEFNGRIYNYVWLKICRSPKCNDQLVNYNNPFEANPYFDFKDTKVEDSASERKRNKVLIVISVLAAYIIFYV